MAFDLFQLIQDQLDRTDIDHEVSLPPIPEEVSDFLGRLALLKGVPLTHLLPDEKLVPKKTQTVLLRSGATGAIEQGALRFFRLDGEWIESLVGGALSVGEEDARALLLNKAMAGDYTADVIYKDALAQFNRQKLGTVTNENYDALLQERLKRKAITVNGDKAVKTASQSTWNYTGFVIHSSILHIWEGLEIRAMGVDPGGADGPAPGQRQLQVVRFDRLSKDVVLCICEGMVQRIEMIPPPEAMHYGAQVKGSSFVIDQDTPVPFRNESLGVVNMAAIGRSGTVQAADVAKRMLFAARPLKVELSINWTEDQNT